MTAYQHTQNATAILAAMAVATVVAIAIGVTLTPIALAVIPVLLIAAWLFSSLTIEVTEDRLRWRFGPGLIRKEVPLAKIDSVQRVRTNVLEGWGIHLSRYGWLYNVSGFDAVAVRLSNHKTFALGTDQPDALLAALQKPRPVVSHS